MINNHLITKLSKYRLNDINKEKPANQKGLTQNVYTNTIDDPEYFTQKKISHLRQTGRWVTVA